ncbi:MAG: guanylate kinase [Lachnospiraceae bacterium]|nr:guanylate kinase [Lachnospiraceae bacterium]
MKRKGILTVVSGFSGSGKGTIMKQLLTEHADTYALSISATTRAPRPGERNGREYFFVSQEEFEEMIRQKKLIEYARYVDNYYGTPRDYVFQQLDQGRDVILEIEIQGALKVKEAYPDTLLLFVSPPDAEELKRRLVNRGTEEEAVIASRLSRAWQEAQGVENYDYFVINDDLKECVQEVHSIIKNEHARAARNQALIENIRAELKSFAKGE